MNSQKIFEFQIRLRHQSFYDRRAAKWKLTRPNLSFNFCHLSDNVKVLEYVENESSRLARKIDAQCTDFSSLLPSIRFVLTHLLWRDAR